MLSTRRRRWKAPSAHREYHKSRQCQNWGTLSYKHLWRTISQIISHLPAPRHSTRLDAVFSFDINSIGGAAVINLEVIPSNHIWLFYHPLVSCSLRFCHFCTFFLVDTNLPYLDLQQIYVRRLGWLLSLPYMILSGLNSICKLYKNTNTYFSLYLQIHKCSDGILGYQSIKM